VWQRSRKAGHARAAGLPESTPGSGGQVEQNEPPGPNRHSGAAGLAVLSRFSGWEVRFLLMAPPSLAVCSLFGGSISERKPNVKPFGAIFSGCFGASGAKSAVVDRMGRIGETTGLGAWDAGVAATQRRLHGSSDVYAIISDGGFQYRVTEGGVLDVQIRDLPEGAKTIDFDRVLMVGDLGDGPKIGTPAVAGAKVRASIVSAFKAEKLVIRKFARRKGYSLKKGHRQKLLKVKIDKIEV